LGAYCLKDLAKLDESEKGRGEFNAVEGYNGGLHTEEKCIAILTKRIEEKLRARDPRIGPEGTLPSERFNSLGRSTKGTRMSVGAGNARNGESWGGR